MPILILLAVAAAIAYRGSQVNKAQNAALSAQSITDVNTSQLPRDIAIIGRGKNVVTAQAAPWQTGSAFLLRNPFIAAASAPGGDAGSGGVAVASGAPAILAVSTPGQTTGTSSSDSGTTGQGLGIGRTGGGAGLL